MRYDAQSFHIDTLVVADGARAYNAVMDNPNGAGQVLFDTVGRYFGPMTLTYYLNVHSTRLPLHLPYLIGNAYCMGSVLVQADGGWSKVVVSTIARSKSRATNGPVVNGQVTLVVPREPLMALRRERNMSPMVAVQLNIPTKYNPPITNGKFAGWQSTKIAQPGSAPGVSHLEDLINQGKRGALVYFVYGRE
ncbi:MAG TPA: hypothetical protein VG984_00285 [Candidatus Paceibacterota bacterium]|nr:hypothetical protein [Candidatus Paceibacterota bacterium]